MNHSEYIKGNKEAWEESFDKSTIGFGERDAEKLKTQSFPFLDDALIQEIKKYDFSGKKVLQLCCNNGREIMSITKNVNAACGVGIDIAENIVAQARANAIKAGVDCEFFAGNVLDVREDLIDQFDAVFVLVGAICWFEDLTEFFKIASLYLKKEGKLFVYEIHPASDIIPLEGDEGYDPENQLKIGWSYFKKEPFKDELGMSYVVGAKFESKVFTSFPHTMSDVINGIAHNDLRILDCKEFDYDVGGNFPHLDNKGFPLTLMIVAEKNVIM